jgi:hypothetical protein
MTLVPFSFLIFNFEIISLAKFHAKITIILGFFFSIKLEFIILISVNQVYIFYILIDYPQKNF